MTNKAVMKILRQHGWTHLRTSGSHYIFGKAGHRPISVPYHGNKDLGTFARDILKEAEIN